VAGDILSGRIRVNDTAELPDRSQPPLRVTSVEFVDNIANRTAHIGLMVTSVLGPAELADHLPPGTILTFTRP
jgi:hypothetical protein